MGDSGTEGPSVCSETNRGPRSCGVMCGEPDVSMDEREVRDCGKRLRVLRERLSTWPTADKSHCVSRRGDEESWNGCDEPESA